MPHVRIEQVGKGQHPSEVVVAVHTADGGTEKLIVDRRSIHDDMLDVGYPVGEDQNRWLIELPRESLRGIWRVWIARNALIESTIA